MQDHNSKPGPYDHHLAAVGEGWLPASIPIEQPRTGKFGLATQAFVITGLKGAEQLALSENRNMRAIAAIMACREVRRQLEENTDFYLA